MAGIVVPAHAQPTDLTSQIPGGAGQTLNDVLGPPKPLVNTMMGRGQAPTQASSSPTLGQTIPPPGGQGQQSDDSSSDDGSSDQDSSQSQAPAPGINRSPALASPQDAAAAATSNDFERQAAENAATILSQSPKAHADAVQANNFEADADAAAKEHLGASNNGLNKLVSSVSGALGYSDDGTNGAPAWARFLGGMPKTPVGRLGVFQSIYGKDNAKFENGQFMYRTSADGDWQQVSPAGIDAASQLPNLAEGVAGNTIAGGMVLGSDGAMANPVGVAVAQGVGQGTAAMLRNALNYAGGVEEAKDFSYQNDFLVSAGLGAGFQAVGTLANKTLIQPIKDIIRDTIPNQMKAAAAIRTAVDSIHDALKLPSPEIAKAMGLSEGQQLTDASVGSITKGAVDHWNEYLGSRVGIVKDTALQNAEAQGMSAFPVNEGLAQLKTVLKGKVLEDENGILRLAMDTHESVESGGTANNALNGLKTLQDTALASSQSSAWGDPKGMDVVKELVNKYNTYNASNKLFGGLPLQDLLDSVESFDKRSAYDKIQAPYNETIRNNFKSIANAFRGNRDSAIGSTLEGTDFADTWKQDYAKYSEKIGLISQFGAQFQNPGSAERISQSILTPKNADGLTKIAQILGPESPQMQGIRDLWLSQRVEGAIEPAKGVFDNVAFVNDIDPKKWGPEMMQQLVPDPTKLNQLKWAASQMEKISTVGFWPSNPDKTVQAASFMTGVMKYPQMAARTLYRLTSGNPSFADYMAKDGINTMIKAANNDEAAKNILSGMGIYEAMVDNSSKVKVGAKTILVPTFGAERKIGLSVPNMANAGQAAIAGAQTGMVNVRNSQMSSMQPGEDDDSQPQQ